MENNTIYDNQLTDTYKKSNIFRKINTKTNPTKILIANPEKLQSEYRVILPHPTEIPVRNESTEENISEGTLRQINEIVHPSEHGKDLRVLSPRYDQTRYKLCWAFALARVLFRYFFQAIKLGYCYSSINLGNHYFKKIILQITLII